MASRFDDVGLFWQDKTFHRDGTVTGGMPAIPDTGWKAPSHFPDLSHANCIALDTETYDPELETAGPGWARGVGHIIGVSLATDDGCWYFPIRHETCPEQNLDPETVLRWLGDVLSHPQQPKIGANLTYDIGWLKQEGVEVRGPLIDVQYAEALLSSVPTVNLDYLANKYLGLNKETDLMYSWLSEWFPKTAKSKLRKWMYLTPPSLAGKYAEEDARLPLLIARIQYQMLKEEELDSVFAMECRLIPLLIAMRFAGVTVDLDRAEWLREDLLAKEGQAQAELDYIAGMHVEVDGSKIYQAFDALGLGYPITKKTGKPSFKKEFLESVEHPVAKKIIEVRNLKKTRGTFIESYILGNHVNGKVYGQFHPLKSESGGAKTGRFSSSMPNLQNIPSRDKYWAPLIRGMFLPDAGHAAWRKYDYSQIEYRFLANYAQGPYAGKIINQYINDPDTDYHQQAGDNIERVTGKVLQNRGHIKNINFGLAYGMGKPKLIRTLGISKQEGEALFEAYHQANPFVSDTFDYYSELAQRQGFIRTASGRKIRFDLWEPERYDDEAVAMPYHQAVATYGNVKRAMTHKALNAVLQGSSADQMKAAMLANYDAGIFDHIGVPRLTIHDELDFSDPGGVDSGFDEMQRIMQDCLKIKVPVKCDCDFGPNWGNVKEVSGAFCTVPIR